MKTRLSQLLFEHIKQELSQLREDLQDALIDATRKALERSEQMTREHLCLIDAILTLPETSLETNIEEDRGSQCHNSVLWRGGRANFLSYPAWTSVEG